MKRGPKNMYRGDRPRGRAGVMLSIGLDFVPGVGTIKGIVEAITGRDIITRQERGWWERVLGIIPVSSMVVGAIAVSKIAGVAPDSARGADKLGDVAEE